MNDLTANERVCRCGKSLASKRTNGCHTIGCTFGDASSSKQNGKPTRTIAEDLIQRASEMAEHVERGGLPMYGAIAREAIAEIEHLQQRVAELERDLLAALQQRNDEVRLRQAAERRSLPPNAGLLKEAADWIEQELKEIGDCDHSVGICACSSQQLLVRLRDAETKDESLPEIEQLGTVTMKCKPATKLEPLPPVETEDRLDSERYRWLRMHVAPTILSRLLGTPREGIADGRPEALDAWLDKRLSQTKTVNVPDGTSASGNARTSDDERSDAGRIETTGVSDETGEGQ